MKFRLFHLTQVIAVLAVTLGASALCAQTRPLNQEPDVETSVMDSSSDEGAYDAPPDEPLTKASIQKGIERAHSQIRFCYLSLQAKTPGKIRVRFVISGRGLVDSARIVEATTKNPKLEACVLGRLKTWQFRKPADGKPVAVSYPFIFKNERNDDSKVPTIVFDDAEAMPATALG